MNKLTIDAIKTIYFASLVPDRLKMLDGQIAIDFFGIGEVYMWSGKSWRLVRIGNRSVDEITNKVYNI